MNANRILKTLVISCSASLLLSACQKYGDSSENTQLNDDQQSFLQSGFNINYLVRNSWYGVMSNDDQTKCLSKMTFSLNKVVNSTFYANDDGVTLESRDLLYTLENDVNLKIDEHDIYPYQSHSNFEFVTNGARFFSRYSDAIKFADDNQTNCRLSIPE